ncbi:hypothetical protein FGO68_gene8900 [Halteria grandinella]|uniref:Uncharacterized protein n=1 Tax=Halteria grandinella TaxID=5974 RepID=A0A8J8NXS3_HALGN|nr:hypothetical protein FGO68_gene8900 [Halteria grandinella]
MLDPQFRDMQGACSRPLLQQEWNLGSMIRPIQESNLRRTLLHHSHVFHLPRSMDQENHRLQRWGRRPITQWYVYQQCIYRNRGCICYIWIVFRNIAGRYLSERNCGYCEQHTFLEGTCKAYSVFAACGSFHTSLYADLKQVTDDDSLPIQTDSSDVLRDVDTLFCHKIGPCQAQLGLKG